MDGGELLRPFGPSQITLQFSHRVGTFDTPLSQKGLKFWPRDAGEFGHFAERQQAACMQSQRHLLCPSACDAAGGSWISSKTLSGTSNVSVTLK